MDRELTFNEIVEVVKQPASRVQTVRDLVVRLELLRDLVNGVHKLSEQANLLPPELHNFVQVQNFFGVLDSLRSGRTTIEDLVFWSDLVSASSLPSAISAPDGGSESAELWKILEVPVATAPLFESLGFSPNDYLKCFGTPAMSSWNLMRWASSEIPTKDVRDWVMAGVPDPDTAAEWMRELRETPEYVMMNYRNFRGDLYRLKEWRDRSAVETNLRNLVLTSPPIALRTPPEPVHLQSPAVPISKIPARSHDWLEEIIARARTVQPSIRKVPHWPARIEFDDEDLTIQLEQFPRAIKGVVIVGRDRRWCEFDPLTFAILSRCETGEDRYVAGMSICWFIDCSITIHSNSSGAARLFVSESTSTSRERTQRVRYIPTPTFRARKREVRTTGRELTIRHKVSGHLRRLPPGRRGSKEARSSAPEHIRRNMLHSETYVEPHFRGTVAEKAELFTRLSRYSALGEAMSDM